MDIKVKQVGGNVFSVVLGDTKVALDGEELKELMLQMTKVLAPGEARGNKSRTAVYKDFIVKLRTANDIGLQGLLTAVPSDHLLVFFKLCEKDKMLTSILLKNMSENSAKMLTEDLGYRFTDELPKNLIEPAMERIIHEANKLEANGSLKFAGA